jgi:hypothetical protein
MASPRHKKAGWTREESVGNYHRQNQCSCQRRIPPSNIVEVERNREEISPEHLADGNVLGRRMFAEGPLLNV